jgi:carbon storage regulator CsrA
MLVLTRKDGEGITVDGPARIVLVKGRHGKARLGVVAPATTTVLREEVDDNEQREGPENKVA